MLNVFNARLNKVIMSLKSIVFVYISFHNLCTHHIRIIRISNVKNYTDLDSIVYIVLVRLVVCACLPKQRKSTSLYESRYSLLDIVYTIGLIEAFTYKHTNPTILIKTLMSSGTKS